MLEIGIADRKSESSRSTKFYIKKGNFGDMLASMWSDVSQNIPEPCQAAESEMLGAKIERHCVPIQPCRHCEWPLDMEVDSITLLCILVR